MSTQAPSNPKLSEQEFLRLEAEKARRLATAALENAKAALGQKLDPAKITRKHPVISIASALIGGFVAAAVVVPSHEDQELRRLRRLHEATHPPVVPAPSNGKPADAKPAEKPTFWMTILHEVITMIKPILVATITAGIKSATVSPPGSDSGNMPQ